MSEEKSTRGLPRSKLPVLVPASRSPRRVTVLCRRQPPGGIQDQSPSTTLRGNLAQSLPSTGNGQSVGGFWTSGDKPGGRQLRITWFLIFLRDVQYTQNCSKSGPLLGGQGLCSGAMGSSLLQEGLWLENWYFLAQGSPGQTISLGLPGQLLIGTCRCHSDHPATPVHVQLDSVGRLPPHFLQTLTSSCWSGFLSFKLLFIQLRISRDLHLEIKLLYYNAFPHQNLLEQTCIIQHNG